MADSDGQAAGESPKDHQRRIERLVGALDTHPDQKAAGMARDLVATVLELHGAGLSKLLGIVAAAGNGDALTCQMLENEHVRALMLLHDLHPEPLETRIANKVERLRPHLGVYGLRPEILDVSDGTVRIHLHRKHDKKIEPSVMLTLPVELEEAIIDVAPEIGKVTIEGLDAYSGGAPVQVAQ